MVTVNGDLIERESIVPAATPGGVHRKRDFDWTNLGCVNLVAGENTKKASTENVFPPWLILEKKIV